MEKFVPFDWRWEISAKAGPGSQHRVKIFDLTDGPTRGAFHVYGRRGINPDHYSAGLVLYELSGDPMTLIRVNGPHPNRHTNRLPTRVELPVAPHVHYRTERYEQECLVRRKLDPDGFALLSTAFHDLDGAMEVLARRANIVSNLTPLPWSAAGRLP